MKKLKEKSIRNRILYISGLNVGIALVLSVIVFAIIYQIINQDLKEHNASLVDLTVEQIENNVELPLEMIENVSVLIEKSYEPDSPIITDYLETIQSSYNYFSEIHIVSMEGKVINTAPYDQNLIGDSILYEPYFSDNDLETGEKIWSELYISSNTGEPTISITIKKEGFIIVADLDLKSLPINLNHGKYFNEIQHISILDQWGSYIVSDDFKNVNQRNRFELFEELEMYELDTDAGFNQKYKIGYSKIEEFNWFIVIQFDYEKTFQNLNYFIILFILIWLAILVIGFLYLRKIFRNVNRELEYLKNRARLIMYNDTKNEDIIVNLKYKELISLNNNFTTMREAILDRENKVKERTKQLEISNAALENSVEEAKSANLAKGKFLSIMSHEMRTPLNGILGFSKMLENTKLDYDQKEMISIIEFSSNKLLDLINDILEMERYSSDKMLFFDENVSIRNILLDELKSFERLIIEKGLEFKVDLDELKDLVVICDEIKIKQLIGNLISNSLKFTKQGGIGFKAKIECIKEKTLLKIEINDSGIGIPPENKELIFTPYAQADGKITKTYGGSGLGLAICKEIVSHYKGDIDYESQLGVGTTFYISLELMVAKKEKESIVDILEDEILIKDVGKIIVADDNVVNQKLMSKYLEKQKLDYIIAKNGVEVLEILSKQKISKILMDCQMPLMDGFEATMKIRELYGNEIEIIAMTAFASDEEEQKCYQAGMDKFITKPIDINHLNKILHLKNFININEEIENLTLNLMEKIEFNYDDSLELIIEYVNQVKIGIDEIKKHYISQEFDNIAEKIHQLKGASACVRADKIKKRFEKAERYIKKGDYEKMYDEIIFISKENLFNS